MKITLVLAAAPDDPLRKNHPFKPLSLPLVAGAAPGHDYTFFDMLSGEELDPQRTTDLVGISYRVTAEATAFRLATELRRRGIPVVLGGPQASASPHRAAQHADAVAVGEGELLWPVIVDHASSGQMRQYYVAAPEPFDPRGRSLHQVPHFLDLRQVPRPLRTPLRSHYAFDTVFAARGCPLSCEFCSVPRLHGKRTRFRPIEDVVREIDEFSGFFYLMDDTVFGRPRSHAYYLELYEQVARLSRRRLWTGQATLDAASTREGRAVIRAAARAGLLYAAVGIESINPDVLRKSGCLSKQGARSAEDVIARVKQHIRFLQQQGILISGWFTLGYEEDRIATFYDTLAFCEEMNIIPILCPLEALPGTRLYERMAAEGRLSEHRRINIVHPLLSDEAILATLADTTRRGFTLAQIVRRTAYYAPRYFVSEASWTARARGLIEKTAFTFVLQTKLKRGVVGLANMGRSAPEASWRDRR